MQAQWLIFLPCITIPCQKSPHFRLIIPRPKVDLLRLLSIILPTVTERILILAIWIDLISKRIVLIRPDNCSTFICKLHHISMWVGHIILFFGVLSLIRIYKINATNISFLYLSTLRQLHHKLIPVPDKNCFFSIHSLASTQSLGIVSIVYIIHLSVTVPRAPWSLLYASPPKLVSYHFRWQVTTALR